MARVEVICEKCGAKNLVEVGNHDEILLPAFRDSSSRVVGRLETCGCEESYTREVVTKEEYVPNSTEKKGVYNMDKIEALKMAGFTDEQINQMVGITGVSLDGAAIIDNETKDEISEEIFANGYVKNTKLHRRWITAKFVRAHFEYNGGVHEYINRLGYMYQFKMMLEEIRVISKLEASDTEAFIERSSFFTKEVVHSTVKQYIKDLETYLNKKNRKFCKGIPYVHISGLPYYAFPKGNVFICDISRKIISPLEVYANKIYSSCSYTELYNNLRLFMGSQTFLNVPATLPKNKLWVDAFKGAGAYYSLKNLAKFSGLKLRNYETRSTILYEATDSVRYLERLVGQKKGFEFYALFKKALEDNNFTLQTFEDICKKSA